MNRNRSIGLLISCEHAGMDVPQKYTPLFAGHKSILHTHRGYDLGALLLAKHMAKALNGTLFYTPITRLLVDVNRSLRRRTLFSEYTKPLATWDKQSILNTYYHPYRERVHQAIKNKVNEDGQVLHIAVHSFTPVWKGAKRDVDIGLLYNPQRGIEKSCAVSWRKEILRLQPQWKVRMNQPYRGKPGGLCATMRREWGDSSYAGFELEINQNFVLSGDKRWEQLKKIVIQSVEKILSDFEKF
ncbi:MAG: N-formylglutamate amidohydrolase [Caldithrix sp.]|nr:N-formylglutamate amidohydrolase [Caldithrix sp.]